MSIFHERRLFTNGLRERRGVQRPLDAVLGSPSLVDGREQRLPLCQEVGSRPECNLMLVPFQGFHNADCHGLGGHDVLTILRPVASSRQLGGDHGRGNLKDPHGGIAELMPQGEAPGVNGCFRRAVHRHDR